MAKEVAAAARGTPVAAGRWRFWLSHTFAALAGALLVLGFGLPRREARLREGLPPPVGAAAGNATLSGRLVAAERTAREMPSIESVAALGRLYHANGYDQAAAACWRLLADEDPAAGRWPHHLAQLARIRSDQAAIARHLAATVERAPDYSPGWLQQADLAFKQARYPMARTAYQRRLQLEPGDPYARLGLARLALVDFDRDAAKDQLLGIIGDHPQFSAAHNLFAQLATEEGQADLAQRHRWLGHQAGRFEQATDPWMQEIEAFCYDPGRLRILGIREYQNDRHASARRLLERAVEVAPEDPGGHELMGDIYLKLGEPERAEASAREARLLFERAGLVVPISVFLNRALALQETDRAAQSVEVLREGLQIHPESYELHNGLGVAWRLNDQVAEAIQSFRDALRINPFDSDANFNLALLLFNRGAREEALFHHRQALKLKPTFAPSLSFLAQHEIAAGRLDTARPYVEKLRDAFSMVPDARRIVADWHWHSGLAARRNNDGMTALREFESAFAYSPDLPGLARELGNAYLDRGEFQRAKAPLEEYHRQAPHDPQAAMLLAQVYARERRFREARELLTQAAKAATEQGDQQLADFCKEILGQLPGR